MALLPVVDRELRVAARKAATHWMRLGAALAAILVWFICFWSNSSSSPSALGHSLFVSVAILLVGGCIGAGPFITADLLSEEKRSGTLGLLFLTPLRVHHVLLGKLAG